MKAEEDRSMVLDSRHKDTDFNRSPWFGMLEQEEKIPSWWHFQVLLEKQICHVRYVCTFYIKHESRFFILSCLCLGQWLVIYFATLLLDNELSARQLCDHRGQWIVRTEMKIQMGRLQVTNCLTKMLRMTLNISKGCHLGYVKLKIYNPIKFSGPYIFNPLRVNFFRGSKNIFTFCVISPHWYNAGSWNPHSNRTRTYLFYIANIMAVDVLAM